MLQEKKRRRRPLGFNIGAEIEKARTRKGLSRRELSRVTGISRTVLIGYETGRTVPGVGELRLLCDALKITPNRFLYGRDQPFKPQEHPLAELGLTEDDATVVTITGILKMLAHDERTAILTLAHAILEARHGTQKLAEAHSALKKIGQFSTQMIHQFGAELVQGLTPEKRAELEAEAKRHFAADSPGEGGQPKQGKAKHISRK